MLLRGPGLLGGLHLGQIAVEPQADGLLLLLLVQCRHRRGQTRLGELVLVVTTQGVPQLGGAVSAHRRGQSGRVVRVGTLNAFQHVSSVTSR